jgi:hypothetical protein
MNRVKPLFALAGIAAATAWPQGRASAQCRLCDQPTTQAPVATPDADVQLQLQATLSFDRLVISGAGNGAATIRPDGGTGKEGSVSSISSRATVGMVTVHGAPNRALRVDIPRRVDLYSLSGGRIVVDDITTDLPSAPRLDAAGNLNFRFGGRLIINGDTDGQYRGDLPITVEYL